MTAVQCVECGRALGSNAALCRPCVDELVEQLLRVPALLHELGITRAGLGRTGTPSAGGRPSEQPLPIRVVGRRLAGESAVQRLETAVIGWARVIGEELGVVPAVHTAYLVDITQAQRLSLRADRPREPIDTTVLSEPVTAVEQAAVWLTHYRREIAQHEAADELARDVGAAVAALGRVIWPAEREYLGLCHNPWREGAPCGHELWADVGDAHTRCRRCRTQYDVAALKTAVLRGAEDGLYKVADLLRLLDRYGHRIPRATLYRWARDRRIEPRGWQHVDERGIRITDHRIDEADVQVYRLGDALKLAAREPNEGGSAA